MEDAGYHGAPHLWRVTRIGRLLLRAFPEENQDVRTVTSSEDATDTPAVTLLSTNEGTPPPSGPQDVPAILHALRDIDHTLKQILLLLREHLQPVSASSPSDNA
jgi:hypothetical protein